MTTPSVSAFRMRFPEFADSTLYPSEHIQFAIDEAVLFTSSASPAKRTIANLYLAAHIVAIAQVASSTGGSAGQLKHQSLGRISETYDTSAKGSSGSNATTTSDDLSSTAYGRRYARIMTGAGLFATICRAPNWRWGC